jgi:amidase
LEGNFASKDAFVVERLRDAGAIIIGKTNLSEWANFRSTQPVQDGAVEADKQKTLYFRS